ncbi:HEAT repeat domain-containing protein [Streptomyces sp. NPDC053493]|uniref:HEAT repeat domain-containing protein n=1 Tax=Streptomyces sp. NPDC053493 TaxID=3365705 RepID=UPI0037D0F15F
MRLPSLLAAVERGDDPVVFDFLDHTTPEALGRDDAVALLTAAAYAGRHEVVDRLVVRDSDVTRPRAGGPDLVTWAARHGRYRVLQALLSSRHDPLAPDSPHRRALRVAQDALRTGSGAGTEPPPAHRAIVTELEAALGVHRSPDELLARALVHADPDHDDWFSSLYQLGLRADQETFDWARELATDRSSLARRRFGLDTVQFLGLAPSISVDDIELSFDSEAVELLRPMLQDEQDPYALGTVIAAFTSYSSLDESHVVLRHSGHPDPRVRRTVASCLTLARADGAAVDRAVLGALRRLAADPDPDVRETALHQLTWSSADTPELRAVLASQLAHPRLEARIAAAGGLALRGDPCGRSVLEEIGADPEHRRTLGQGGLGDLRHLLTSAPAPPT